MGAKELDGSEMQRVEGSQCHGEGLERARKDRRLEFDEGDPCKNFMRCIPVRSAKLERIQADPESVLEQTTGNQRKLPQRVRRPSIL